MTPQEEFEGQPAESGFAHFLDASISPSSRMTFRRASDYIVSMSIAAP
jgi:hypothetical protein